MAPFSVRSWLKSWRSASPAARRPTSGRPRLLLEPLEDRYLLAIFGVTNQNDSGPGSLRQAILNANANSGLDVIRFEVRNFPACPEPPPPPFPPYFVGFSPTSSLPTITDPVSIAGPNLPCRHEVVISGNNAGQADGLTITASGSTVSALRIQSFRGHGIVIRGGSDNTIQNSDIIRNGQSGVSIENGARNRLRGNAIGIAGPAAAPNQGDGVTLGPGARDTVIGGPTAVDRNTISGNTNAGVSIYWTTASGNRVQGNYLGTTAAGTAALGNGVGIWLAASANRNDIDGNLISGNRTAGIAIRESATLNTVRGNKIGTNATGTAAIPNVVAGIEIYLGAVNNTVGGGTAADRNVISGNRFGVRMYHSDTNYNVVQNNFIGTNAAGTAALRNTEEGIWFGLNASGNAIRDNLIAFNGADGVHVAGDSGNSLSRNAIHSNGGLGIDLGPDGVTPNDNCDTDIGSNDLQNYPVLTSASSTVVQGTLNSTANRTFRLEFFASSSRDPSDFGEGQRFVGSANVTTSAGCAASFSATLNEAVPAGQFLSATATDAAGNTSEFSRSLLVTGPAVTYFSVISSANPVTAGTPFSLTVAARDRDGAVVPGYRGTVRFTSSDGSATLPPDYTFTAADNGQHTFTDEVALYAAGAQAVRVTDTATATVTGNANLTVNPGPAAFYYLYPEGGPVTAGVPFDLYVWVMDAYYNIVPDYAQEVGFVTSDAEGVVPPPYPFTPADGGFAYFFEGVTLVTPGSQELYAYDTATFSIIGYAVYEVGGGSAPVGRGGGPTLAGLRVADGDIVGAAARALSRPAADWPAPPSWPTRRERLWAGSTPPPADGVPYRSPNRTRAAVDAYYGSASFGARGVSPTQSAAATPEPDGFLHWEGALVSDR